MKTLIFSLLVAVAAIVSSTTTANAGYGYGGYYGGYGARSFGYSSYGYRGYGYGGYRSSYRYSSPWKGYYRDSGYRNYRSYKIRSGSYSKPKVKANVSRSFGKKVGFSNRGGKSIRFTRRR